MIDRLEPRRLFSVTLDEGTLVVTGTPGDDAIDVSRQTIFFDGQPPSDRISVRVFGSDGTLASDGWAPAADVFRIEVAAGRGHDTVIVQGQGGEHSNFDPIPQAVTVFGGRGNDRIVGGAGDDVLAGQAGNDMLFGDEGNDQVLGGRGADVLVGGVGADALEGGGSRGSADTAADPDPAAGDAIRGAHVRPVIAVRGVLRNDIVAIGGDTHGWLLQDRHHDDRLTGIEVNARGVEGLPRETMPPREARVVGRPVVTNFLERGKVVSIVAEAVDLR